MHNYKSASWENKIEEARAREREMLESEKWSRETDLGQSVQQTLYSCKKSNPQRRELARVQAAYPNDKEIIKRARSEDARSRIHFYNSSRHDIMSHDAISKIVGPAGGDEGDSKC